MRATSFFASCARHILGVGLQALLIAAIVATLAFAAASMAGSAPGGADSVLAGKPTAGHISVPDGVFGGTTTATANPGGDVSVHAQCIQNGVAVWAQVVRVNADNQAVLTLGPTPRWSGGAAECTAAEGYWTKTGRWRVMATTTFHVSE